MSLRTALHIDIAGNFSEKLRGMGRALGNFGANSAAPLAAVKRGLESAGRGLDSLANKYTGLLSGAGLAAAASQVVALEDRINALAVAADKPVEAMEGLKQKVLEVSQLPDIRLDPNAILDAVDMIVEKTGDMAYAEKNLANIARAIKASGAEGAAMGTVFADLNQKLRITSAEETLATMDILVKQGKKASFTMKDLADVGPRVTSAMAVWGRVGKQGAREMGALLQIGIQAAGSKDVAATGLEALTRDLVAKAKDLRKMGVSIFDPEELAKGRKTGRPLPEIVKDLLRKTNGDPEKLRKILGDESGRFIAMINDGFKSTGGFGQLDELLKVDGDGSQIAKDAAVRAQTTESALTSLQGAFTRFADANLSGPIKATASVLDEFSPERVQQVLMAGTAIAGTVVALVAARKGMGLARSIGETLSTIKNGKPGANGVDGLALGVQKVFVVNMPGSLPGASLDTGIAPGAGGGAPAEAAKRTARQRMADAARRAVGFFKGSAEAPSGARQWVKGLGTAPGLTRALGVLGAGMGVYQAVKLASNDALSTGEKVKGVGGIAGGWAGGVAGAKLGAMAGTMIAPGVGTVVGGLLGGAVGGLAGGELSTKLIDYFQGQKEQKPAEAEVTGRMTIQIQSDRPVTVGNMVTTAPGLELEASYLGMNGGW